MASEPTVEQHFVARERNVAATYAALLRASQRLGPVREDPKKTSIHLVRDSAFAGIATQKSALILTFKSDKDVRSKRIKKREQASAQRWHLEVRLEQPSEVDDELRAWLTRSYALAGPRTATKRAALVVFLACVALAGGGSAQSAPKEVLAVQVRAAESAFAKSMAARDLAAFAAHLADEAVFFGGKGVLRGKAAVRDGWKRHFEGPKAPFAWEPGEVEVLDSGTLALSSGPVFDAAGKRIGTFNSVWRREPDGRWKIVFDKGCPPCESP